MVAQHQLGKELKFLQEPLPTKARAFLPRKSAHSEVNHEIIFSSSKRLPRGFHETWSCRRPASISQALSNDELALSLRVLIEYMKDGTPNAFRSLHLNRRCIMHTKGKMGRVCFADMEIHQKVIKSRCLLKKCSISFLSSLAGQRT